MNEPTLPVTPLEYLMANTGNDRLPLGVTSFQNEIYCPTCDKSLRGMSTSTTIINGEEYTVHTICVNKRKS